MALDPQIIGGVKVTPNQTPDQAAEGVEKQTTALDQARQTIQNARDDAAIRQAFANAGQGADPNDVVKQLQPVAPGAAMKLSASIAAQQKTMAETEKTKLESLTTRMTLASQAMQYAKDHPEDPNAYPAAKSVAGPLLGVTLPDQADPTTIGQIYDQGQKAADAIRAKKNAIDAVLASQKSAEGWDKAAAQAFSLAQSPDDWAATTAHLYALGAPKESVLSFGAYSPDTVAKAQKLSMTPDAAANLGKTTYQAKSVLLDGKPTEVRFSPQTGKYTDANNQDVTARVRPIPPASTTVVTGGLSTTALDQAAQTFHDTGVLPPLGMGTQAAATRRDIMNRSAELFPDQHLAVNSAEYKANAKSLANLQPTLDTLQSFESAAGSNLKTALALAEKIPDSGVPWANTPLRSLNRNLLGSSNQVGFEAARDVALREIARVTSNPKLTGQLSDSQRQEVQALLDPNLTLGQFKKVAGVLTQDMDNVRQGLTDQIAQIKQRIGGTSGKIEQWVIDPTTGKLVPKGGG